MKIMPVKRIRAKLIMPPDKSITHRVLILSSMAKDKSILYNLLNADDTKRTYNILKSLGIKFKGDFNKLEVYPKTIKEIEKPLYCGNSGTTARLISGYLSSKNGLFVLYGDKSLSKRPMERIITPLEMMGAKIDSRKGYLPLIIKGNKLKGIDYTLPIPSAQLKSSIILAALNSEEKTIIKGDKNSRDHTERLIKQMNGKIDVKNDVIYVEKSVLEPLKYSIPGDFSSAAFFITLAILHPNAKIIIDNINLNPTRIGFLKILEKMNANISYEIFESNPEPIGRIIAESSNLKGIKIPEKLIPNAIDELPLIALVGLKSEGRTILKNASELRVKESDRIKSVVSNLKNLGIEIEELKDGFVIDGKQDIVGGKIKTYNDHRIAMMFSIAGLISKEGIEIDNVKSVNISFPTFFKYIEHLSF
ncbi:3-phosphoshikimate 1-carboxyvinyltransferase [Marinitoga sp. 38H-ov]|uniref:3-phosphoshikimate 1-carboxyvinyltransferase n=1 Tax=Marinitoga sp. 38H-ov TaxID=1755814 RepID=UPI0013EDCF0D|nr:3-phosphoshikimate 1-carboxyvinyltransferase [Marinitoga sp. 38H-ov]KAF2955957.1 3-phosphoshikimate 1-carboxyvinyltransferase [Marinitoga sp. 38H-ov]